MNYLKVCGAGLLISWLGALPLGTLNVTAFDIAVSQGFQNAFLFAISVVLVELLYVRLSLLGNKKLVLDEQWTTILLVLGALLLGYLGITSFLEPIACVTNVEKSDLLTKISSPIALGILLSGLNPLQFPYWLTWNKVLTNKKILKNDTYLYSFYLIGIGVGTLLALTLFIWLGHSLLPHYQEYNSYANTILGAIYFGFSICLLYTLYRKKLNPILE